jgi:GT2 family glycosyltransferase
MNVFAVVVSHGHARELAESLPLLREQVDGLLVIANVPGSVPAGVDAVHNERPLGFAANLNRGFAHTQAEALLAANPDAVPDPGAVTALCAFMEEHPRCGVAGPRMVFPDGAPQPSRRRFPTVGGEGFRLYGEDIDLQYRAMRAGWERWYVPVAVVRHEHKAETDKRWLTRRTLWHWAGIMRFVRKHPERLLAL